jgi:hypothetical protein
MMIQHASPITIDSLEQPVKIARLNRLRRSPTPGAGPHFLENLLQRLIHEHPATLPVDEIEPSFSHLRSVCQELRLGFDGGTRYVDNLLINPEGRICLVECKLWHNPEAVREVVAQILSYAGALAALQYDGLLAAVRQTLKRTDGDPLSDRVIGPEADEEERESLVDGISRSLRLGNFLLLVVGDGIRSGVQQIAQVLQNATLGFSFGLIEMALYGGSAGVGPYYLQPRILARTEIITRTVFVTGDDAGGAKITKVEPAGKAQTLSEKEFFDQLEKVDPSFPDEVRSFLDRCKALGCVPQLKRNLTLYADDPSGGRINLGGIKRDGSVELWGMAGHDAQYGEAIGRRYMEQIVAFLPSARIKDEFPSPTSWHIRYQDRATVPLREMLAHQDEWLAAIQAVIERFRMIEHSQEGNSTP